MNNLPIGIFDSGIGGLTVAKAISKQMPQESILYLGDTSRVPYGNRSKETITSFALELTKFMLTKQVKCIVVACNTISATCLPEIQAVSSVPVFGVINPSVNAIIKTTKTKKVGIIGTLATIQSEVYIFELKKKNPAIQVITKACPLFVPLAEEGLGESDIAKLTAKHYLSNFQDIDTLHLGCTHFPLLRSVIKKSLPEGIAVIDSAEPTAQAVQTYLTKENLLTSHNEAAKNMFYFTDDPKNIPAIAQQFYGKNITDDIYRISLYPLKITEADTASYS